MDYTNKHLLDAVKPKKGSFDCPSHLKDFCTTCTEAAKIPSEEKIYALKLLFLLAWESFIIWTDECFSYTNDKKSIESFMTKRNGLHPHDFAIRFFWQHFEESFAPVGEFNNLKQELVNFWVRRARLWEGFHSKEAARTAFEVRLEREIANMDGAPAYHLNEINTGLNVVQVMAILGITDIRDVECYSIPFGAGEHICKLKLKPVIGPGGHPIYEPNGVIWCHVECVDAHGLVQNMKSRLWWKIPKYELQQSGLRKQMELLRDPHWIPGRGGG